ncbi:hypothetical protein ACX80W_13910 [Arthrobacter sp. TMN-37]
MTEEHLPDEDLTIITDSEVEERSLAELDPLTGGRADLYPNAAEDNPDRWQDDPLLQGEGYDDEESNLLTDQILRDETAEARWAHGDEQIPPDVPTLGEASDDVDFGIGEDDDEVDSSDDPSNRGGAPLSHFDEKDLE